LETTCSSINLYSRLAPLDEKEVCSYVLHRLRIAGCTKQLFSLEALSSIAVYSRGIPLNINMICRHCLSLAAAVNVEIIDERLVSDSAYDLVLKAQPNNSWNGSRVFPAERQRRDYRGLRLIKR
jgi:general secretion pathway protein A